MFLSGVSMPFKAIGFLFKNRGLKRYAVLPLLANIVLYILILLLSFWLLYRWEVKPVEWDFWGPVGSWLTSAYNWLGWLVKIIVAAAIMAVAFFTFTGVGMVIASPLNDLLSEKVEAVYVGSAKSIDLPLRITAKAIFTSIYDSAWNLCRQFFYMAITLPFLFIPIVGFLPMFIASSYFSGFGFIDAAMSRNYLRMPHKKLLGRGNFWRIAGFGMTMQILFFIPFVGLLLMPVGVTAGTLMYCQTDWEGLFAASGLEKPLGFAVPVKKGDEGEREDEMEAAAGLA